MGIISRLSPAAIFSLLVAGSTASDHDHHAIKFVTDETSDTLPMALSDMSATYDKSTNLIYIVGGCNDGQGNALQDEGYFACTKITSKTYAYNPDNGVFQDLDDAPRPRYRHSAANVNGKIWLTGGRTVEDNLIPEVDVYDPGTKSWSTVASFPEDLQVSDQASFSDNDHLYVLGGYNSAYNATVRLVRFDTKDVVEKGLVLEEMEPLANERGDVHAVTINDKFAVVTGGYTHGDGYCSPLNSTERYDMNSNTWQTLAELKTGRADKALVALGDHVFAIGGEAKDSCVGDPGEYTLALDDVEFLDTTDTQNEWTVFKDLSKRRFRFSGVEWPDTNSVYTLGGQEFYDASCKCFKTSNLISKYTEKIGEHPESSGAGAVLFNSVAVFMFAVGAAVLN